MDRLTIIETGEVIGLLEMKLSKKILILCHCLLNANAKIVPLAACGGYIVMLLDRTSKREWDCSSYPVRKPAISGSIVGV